MDTTPDQREFLMSLAPFAEIDRRHAINHQPLCLFPTPPAASDAGSQLSADEKKRLASILSGEVTLPLYVEFLSRNNHTDPLILKATKDLAQKNNIMHNATVIANSFMSCGTTSDAFLRENKTWLSRATNWAKFTAVASLGVIHKVPPADMVMAASFLFPPSLLLLAPARRHSCAFTNSFSLVCLF